MDKEYTFETAMARLETITEQIQSNECTLEESLTLYEEGIRLSKFCKGVLDSFQSKLNELSNQNESTDNNESLPF